MCLYKTEMVFAMRNITITKHKRKFDDVGAGNGGMEMERGSIYSAQAQKIDILCMRLLSAIGFSDDMLYFVTLIQAYSFGMK